MKIRTCLERNVSASKYKQRNKTDIMQRRPLKLILKKKQEQMFYNRNRKNVNAYHLLGARTERKQKSKINTSIDRIMFMRTGEIQGSLKISVKNLKELEIQARSETTLTIVLLNAVRILNKMLEYSGGL